MSTFKLDISKFKKVSSDDHSTIMKDPSGHHIVLSHAALDKKKLKELQGIPSDEKSPQKLADGGKLEPMDVEPVQPAQDSDESQDPPSPRQSQQPEEAESQSPGEPTNSAPMPEPIEKDPAETFEANGPVQSAGQLFSADKGNNINVISQEDAALGNDIANGHIKPETYSDLFGKKDTLGKIGTIFGLMVGGMGAGLTHQENPLIAMWNKQISNDLEAQKANVSNKVNLLQLNRQRFGDLESAQNFTIMQQNRIALHDLAQKVQSLPMGSPQRANAEQQLQAVGMFVNTQNMQLTDQIAAKQALMHGMDPNSVGGESSFQQQQQALRMSGDPALMRLADENESHHFPGIPGKSSAPLSEGDKADLEGKMQLDQALKNYINFAQKNGGSLDPRVIAQGKALAADLQGKYRMATHGGVYKEGESNFIQTLIDSNPSKFANELRGVIPKAQELSQANRSAFNVKAKTLGFPVQDQTQSAPSNQNVLTSKSGRKIVKGQDGKWYYQ